MLHYGFCTNFCNPNSGHEKGHIENKVGYNRRNFLVPIPEFEDIKEFNRELLKKCDQDMERNHYNKSGTIAGSQHFFGQFAKPLLKGARFSSASATVWG